MLFPPDFILIFFIVAVLIFLTFPPGTLPTPYAQMDPMLQLGCNKNFLIIDISPSSTLLPILGKSDRHLYCAACFLFSKLPVKILLNVCCLALCFRLMHIKVSIANKYLEKVIALSVLSYAYDHKVRLYHL